MSQARVNTAPAGGGLDPAERTGLARRAAVASVVGTAVEWYDYFIFGTASALVFGRLFFPSDGDPIIGTLSAFAVFGVGFFFRPLGGIVFGHLGDRLGRKKTLVVTLMTMGIATFLIGCLPTAESIGILAPILLVVLRLVQGLGVGGEWGGATLVAVEFAPPGKRGVYGAFPQVGNAIGLVAATGIWALMAMLPDDQLDAWGWRVPFLLSIVLIVVGMVIRMKLTETPAFLEAQRQAEARQAAGEKTRLPLADVFRRSWRRLLLTMGMRLGEGVAGYVVLTLVLSYSETYTDIPRADAILFTTVAALFGIVTFWVLGRLSDRIGRRWVFVIGAGVSVLMAYPVFAALGSGSILLSFVVVIVAYAVGVGGMYAVESSFFAELFPTSSRYTGLSLAAQIPSMVVGVWPFAATAMLAATGGDPLPVVLVVVGCSLLALVCALIAPETKDADIEQDDVPARKAATR